MSNKFKVFWAIFLSCGIMASPLGAGRWGKNRLWKDGRAEVAVYDSERVVNGQPRKFREQLIVIKEDFRVDTFVKADKPKKKETIKIFKLNVIQKFDTENYPYSYLTSVFVKDSPLDEVLKITVGSQEWLGNIFKIYKKKLDGNTGVLESHSYSDGKGDETETITLSANDYFEDQLPLSLRGLDFDGGGARPVRIWSSLTENRSERFTVQKATIQVKGEELVRCHAGSLPSWKVVINKESGEDIYWFSKKYPHILTKMVTHDGRSRFLYARSRWKYWDKRFPMPNVLK